MQSEDERCKHSTMWSTSISGNNIRITMSIKTKKLCPVCRISKYPMNESMGNVHFNEFLGKNVWWYGIKSRRKVKNIAHAELSECSKCGYRCCRRIRIASSQLWLVLSVNCRGSSEWTTTGLRCFRNSRSHTFIGTDVKAMKKKKNIIFKCYSSEEFIALNNLQRDVPTWY